MKKALLAILALGSLVVSAQSIVKESPLGAYGAMHWTLSNGINVYVKASKLQPGWITIAGTSPGGYSHNYTPAQASSLKQLNTVMAVSGAGGMTAVELGKMLRADSARMRTYVERDEEGFAGSCKRTGLETALKVLQLKALHPQIDTAAVNKYVAVNKKANAKHGDPKFAFADSIFANVFGHHPVGSEKVSNYDLDHIDLDFILQVYQDRFADLSDMSVFVVGDFDPDSLKTLVVKYIATLPGKGRSRALYRAIIAAGLMSAVMYTLGAPAAKAEPEITSNVASRTDKARTHFFILSSSLYNEHVSTQCLSPV